MQGVKFVKHPPGKAFAFVEFVSPEAARAAVDASARRGLVVQGRTLTVGWANEKKTDGAATGGGSGGGSGAAAAGGGGDDAAAEREKQLIPPSEDAKTLFIGGLLHFDPSAEVTEDPSGSPLHSALAKIFPGMVSVNRPLNKSYAFVEFSDYASAMAAVTASIHEPRSQLLQGRTLLSIGWAKGEATAPAASGSRAAGSNGVADIGYDVLPATPMVMLRIRLTLKEIYAQSYLERHRHCRSKRE